VFIPKTEMAVSGTEGGDIVVWDRSLIIEGIGEQNEKRLIKVVTLNQDIDVGINVLMTCDDKYLVVGNSNGTIRFYDFDFKVKAWFEDLKLNTIKSISFSKKQPMLADPKAADHEAYDKESQDHFKCSEFIVADSNAVVVQLKPTIFEDIDTSKKKGTTLMNGIKSAISAIAVHPTKPIIAAAGSDGFIIFWDYLNKGDLVGNQYEFFNPKENRDDKADGDKKNPQAFFTAMTFTPNGEDLLVGDYKGYIKIVDPVEFKFKKMSMELKTSDTGHGMYLTKMVVNDEGNYFATADTQNCVCVFKYAIPVGDKVNHPEWFFNGKIRSHEIEITDIAWGKSLDEND